ncbi:remodeling and spacing factor 1-like [Liolophura sinensis]|uniref:remodeling and spacing factor 1-like n=1 Tax=Liolophura sinensis TaxID=3198878 RepID=UPI003158360C
MASARESICQNDPNFAVICSFLNRYGDLLGIPKISFAELQTYLEETKYVSDVLIDLHVRLLRKLGKTSANFEKWERCVTKFCYAYSGMDGWEMEELGYAKVTLNTRLRILKNLLEAQFDSNNRFKDKINDLDAADLRFLPIGRDKNGLAYWYLLDEDFNLRVYKEEQDDEDAESWQLVCSNRNELAELIAKLQSADDVPQDKDKLSTTSGDSDGKDEEGASTPKVKVEVEMEEEKTVKVKSEKYDSGEEEVLTKAEVVIEAEDIKVKPEGVKVEVKAEVEEDLDSAAVILVRSDTSVKVSSEVTDKERALEQSNSTGIQGACAEASGTEWSEQGPESEKVCDAGKEALDKAAENVSKDSVQAMNSTQEKGDNHDTPDSSQKDSTTVKLHIQIDSKSVVVHKDKVPAETDKVSVSLNKSEPENKFVSGSKDGCEMEIGEKSSKNSTECIASKCAETSESPQLSSSLITDVQSVSSVREDNSTGTEKQETSGTCKSDALVEDSNVRSDEPLCVDKSADVVTQKHICERNSPVCIQTRGMVKDDSVKDEKVLQKASEKCSEKSVMEMDITASMIPEDDSCGRKSSSGDVGKLCESPHESGSAIMSADREMRKPDAEKANDRHSIEDHGEYVPSEITECGKVVREEQRRADKCEKVSEKTTEKDGMLSGTQSTSTSKGSLSEAEPMDESKPEVEGKDVSLMDKDVNRQVSTQEDKSSTEVDERCSNAEKLKDEHTHGFASEHIVLKKPTDEQSENSDTKDFSKKLAEGKTSASKTVSTVKKHSGSHKEDEEALHEGASKDVCKDALTSKAEESSTSVRVVPNSSKVNTEQTTPETANEDEVVSGEKATKAMDLEAKGTASEKTDKNNPVIEDKSPSLSGSKSSLEQAANKTQLIVLEKESRISAEERESKEVSTTSAGKTNENVASKTEEDVKTQSDSTQAEVEEGETDVVKADRNTTQGDTTDVDKTDVPDTMGVEGSKVMDGCMAVKGDIMQAASTETQGEKDKTENKEDISACEAENVSKESCKTVVKSETVEVEEKSNVEDAKSKGQHSEMITDKSEMVKEPDKMEEEKSTNVEARSKKFEDSKTFEEDKKAKKEPEAVKYEDSKGVQRRKIQRRIAKMLIWRRRKRCVRNKKWMKKTIQNKKAEEISETGMSESEKSMEETCEKETKEKELSKMKNSSNQTFKVEISKKKHLRKKRQKLYWRARFQVRVMQTNKTQATSEELAEQGTKAGKKGEEITETPDMSSTKETSSESKEKKPTQKPIPPKAAPKRKSTRTSTMEKSLRQKVAKSNEASETESKESTVPDSKDGNVPDDAKPIKKTRCTDATKDDDVTNLAKMKMRPEEGRARGRGRGRNRGNSRRSRAKKVTEESDDSDDDLPLIFFFHYQRKKVESDEEFQVKQTRGKGKGGTRKGRQRRLATSEEDTDREQEEEEERLVFEALEASDSSEELSFHYSSSDSPMEEVDEDYTPQKQGRNARRAAARSGEHELVSNSTGQKDESQSEVDDDTPCCKCLKFNQPEWILLCDKCDAGYHTACLRPPLMIIPDGDWFCPPCQHKLLVERLTENLKDLDTALKKYERLLKRKERLAYVGISLDNIVKEERKENVAPEYLDYEYDVKPKKKHHSSSRPKEEEVFLQRTCRARTSVSYQFKEYDELINSAIQDDVKEPPPPGISRGKDMYNIEEAESKPSPVSKKRKKRRLTGLDEDFEDDEDDSEEYRATDDSEVTPAEEEEEEEDVSSSGDSSHWRSVRTRRFGKPTRKSSRKGGRWTRYDADFVVDDDYESDASDNCRRSTRSATKRRVCYRESNSEESEAVVTPSEEYSSDDSRPSKRKKRPKIQKQKARSQKRKGVLYSDESEEAEETEEEDESDSSRGSHSETSDDDSTLKLRSKIKKKNIIESDNSEESSDSQSERKPKVRQSRRASAKKVNYNKLLESDSGEDTEEMKDQKTEVKGKFSLKNFAKGKESDSEDSKLEKSEENSEESEKEGSKKSSEPKPRGIKITAGITRVVERTNSPEEFAADARIGDSEKSESPKVSNSSSNGNSVEEAGLAQEPTPSNGHSFDQYTPQMPPPFPHGYGYDTSQYQYYPNNQSDTYQPQGYFPPPPQGNMPYRGPGHHPGMQTPDQGAHYPSAQGMSNQRPGHPGIGVPDNMCSPSRDIPSSGPHRPQGVPPPPHRGHTMPYPDHREQRMLPHQGPPDTRYQELQPPNGGPLHRGMPPHTGFMRPGGPHPGMDPSHRGVYPLGPEGRHHGRVPGEHAPPRGSFMMDSILRPKGYGEGDDDDLSDVSDLISYVTQDT